MISVECDGFRFDFEDVLDAFIFDEKDKSRPTYHGVTALKSVDILVECKDYWYFIEVKDFHDLKRYEHEEGENQLREILKYKFRDSYLYRHAEQAINKPIIYICFLANMENALCGKLCKTLKTELPIGIKTERWSRELARNCFVVNQERWNRNFPHWRASRIS
ncbi:MAG: hypothetical protein ACRC10_04200 [Thermoguttaceae bacterium]